MMIKVIGVRFRTAGKIYFFDPLQFEIKRGDQVIVETARGIEFGTVVVGAKEVEEEKVVMPLKPVLRLATQRDKEQEKENRQKEREAFKICLEKIRKRELDMKLIDAEYTFDNNKVLFYFTADGRIDFRELVKDLAAVFKTRIELRQIGVRDETKIMGGIGVCGRPLCCHSYLADFVPVSIKMAEEQNLSLNPTKISGVCGRLMCCLKNEEETYEELNRNLPGIGDTVSTEDGLKGEVQSVNVLRQLVKVLVEVGDEKELKEYEVDKLTFRRKHGRKDKLELTKEEMVELKKLEQEEEEFLEEKQIVTPLEERAKKDRDDKNDDKEEGKENSGTREHRDTRNRPRDRHKNTHRNPEQGNKAQGDKEHDNKAQGDKEGSLGSRPDREKPDRNHREHEKPRQDRTERQKPGRERAEQERGAQEKTEQSNGNLENSEKRRRQRNRYYNRNRNKSTQEGKGQRGEGQS